MSWESTAAERARQSAHPTTTSSVKPTLPVETLTEIFKIALGSIPTPSSPFQSPISPCKPFVSLLLASRTLRALAIPFLYRSITIARPSDWVTFFGVGRGVSVTGADLEQKRRALEEICLVEEADFPLDLDAEPTLSFTCDPVRTPANLEYLAPLDLSGLHVQCLVIVPLTSSKARLVEALAEGERDKLVELISADQDIRDEAANEIATNADISLGDVFHEEVDDLIESTVRWTIKDSQHRATKSFLDRLQPSTLRLFPLSMRILSIQGSYPGSIRIVTYRQTSTVIEVALSDRRVLKRTLPASTIEMSIQEQARIKARTST